MRRVVEMIVVGGVVAGCGAVGGCKVKREVVKDKVVELDKGLEVEELRDMKGIVGVRRSGNVVIEEPEIVVEELGESLRRMVVRGRVMRSCEDGEVNVGCDERIAKVVRDSVSVKVDSHDESRTKSTRLGWGWLLVAVAIVSGVVILWKRR